MLEPVKPFTVARKPVFSGAAPLNAARTRRINHLPRGALADALGLAVAPHVFRQDQLVPLVDQVADGLADQ